MAVKQSGKTQGESDCRAERGNSWRKGDCNCHFLVPPKIFYFCLVFHSILRRFLASFLAEIYPSGCPVFPASFLAFLPVLFFFGYVLVCLFLPCTPRESDCKTERKNSRRKSDCNCICLVPPKIILLLPSFPLDFATVFGQFFG